MSSPRKIQNAPSSDVSTVNAENARKRAKHKLNGHAKPKTNGHATEAGTLTAGIELPEPPPLDPSPLEIEVVTKMNEQHAVITMGGNTRIMTIQPSMLLEGATELEFAKKADFELRYSHQRHPVGLTNGKPPKPIVKSVAEIWLASPLRRQYERMIFDPMRTPRGDDAHRVYNLWCGFPYKNRAKRGCWKKFRTFITEVICEGNEEHGRWVVGWMARCIQRPYEPAGVALVLHGEQGIGKGFFANHFGKLYDPTHFVAIQKRDHLTGRFNALLQGAMLTFVDEAFFAGDPTIKGPLKALITEPRVVIERKGLDPIQYPNMRAFILASNEALVVPAEMDARRWAIFNVASSHANDRTYFAEIDMELRKGGYEAMMHDLLAFDLDTIDPYTAPVTRALIEQKQLNLTAPEKFIFDCLKRGEYPTAFDGWVPWDPAKEVGFSKDQAVRSYFEQLQGQRAHTGELRSAETVLGLTVQRLFPDVRTERLKINDKKGISQRIRVWKLPGLTKAREQFAHKLGSEFPWED